MSNYIQMICMDVITYECPKPDYGLVNINPYRAGTELSRFK